MKIRLEIKILLTVVLTLAGQDPHLQKIGNRPKIEEGFPPPLPVFTRMIHSLCLLAARALVDLLKTRPHPSKSAFPKGGSQASEFGKVPREF